MAHRLLAWQRRHLAPPLIRSLVTEIPAAVEWVVLTALHKSPNRRFKTMLDFTLEFEEACRSIKKGVSPKTFASNLPAIDRVRTGIGFTYIQHHQRSVGLVSQPEFAEQGDVLVATYPVARNYWQSDEDFWDHTFTSVGGGIGLALTSRWQNFWRRIRCLWQRIAEYLLESM